MWLSLVNSLKIGWKELDLGTWLSNMHPQRITFQSDGWMNVFLISQSILGRFLLALFLLTFFGAPFNTW